MWGGRIQDGSEVRSLDFIDLNCDSKFNGVWACALLLHLSSREMPQVLSLVYKTLGLSGV